jgi:hypothetical protein
MRLSIRGFCRHWIKKMEVGSFPVHEMSSNLYRSPGRGQCHEMKSMFVICVEPIVIKIDGHDVGEWQLAHALLTVAWAMKHTFSYIRFSHSQLNITRALLVKSFSTRFEFVDTLAL